MARGRGGNPFLRGAGMALVTLGQVFQAQNEEDERLRLLEEERNRQFDLDLRDQIEGGVAAQNREQLDQGQLALQRLMQREDVERPAPEVTGTTQVQQQVEGPGGIPDTISAEFGGMPTPDVVPTVEQLRLQNALTGRERRFERQEEGDVKAAAIDLLRNLTPKKDAVPFEDAITAAAMAANRMGLDMKPPQIRELAEEITPEAERVREVFGRAETDYEAKRAEQIEADRLRKRRQKTEPIEDEFRQIQMDIQRNALTAQEDSAKDPFRVENRRQLLSEPAFLRMIDTNKVDAFERGEIGLQDALAKGTETLAKTLMNSVMAVNEQRSVLGSPPMSIAEIGQHLEGARLVIQQMSEMGIGGGAGGDTGGAPGAPLPSEEEMLRVLMLALPNAQGRPSNIMSQADEEILFRIPAEIRQQFHANWQARVSGTPTGGSGNLFIDPNTLR